MEERKVLSGHLASMCSKMPQKLFQFRQQMAEIMGLRLCIRLSLNIGSIVNFFKKLDHFSWCDDKMLSWKMLDVSCILRLFHCCKEE